MLRFVLLLFLLGTAFSLAYPENPPVAHTGGFGEPTCYSCHFDGELNDGFADLSILGIDSLYTPGRDYELTVSLKRAQMVEAGFQLALRDTLGRQAGMLMPVDQRVSIDESNGVLYVRHSPPGTALIEADSTAWTFLWQAPDTAAAVHIHLSANAANGDASEFGDAIYGIEHRLNPID